MYVKGEFVTEAANRIGTVFSLKSISITIFQRGTVWKSLPVVEVCERYKFLEGLEFNTFTIDICFMDMSNKFRGFVRELNSRQVICGVNLIPRRKRISFECRLGSTEVLRSRFKRIKIYERGA